MPHIVTDTAMLVATINVGLYRQIWSYLDLFPAFVRGILVDRMTIWMLSTILWDTAKLIKTASKCC